MLNQYIPYNSLTADLEQAYLNDMKAKRLAAEEFDRIGNSFERISEQLGILHASFNAVQQKVEVSNAK